MEPGEECDDDTSCCKNCQLATGATCSTGNLGFGVCCTSECQYLPVTVECEYTNPTGKYAGLCLADGYKVPDSEVGYCSNGLGTPNTVRYLQQGPYLSRMLGGGACTDHGMVKRCGQAQ